jgi:hypothetical protein
MTPVQACSICNGAIVGFGNNAQPVNDGRCCDRCYSETVVPERARQVLESLWGWRTTLLGLRLVPRVMVQ